MQCCRFKMPTPNASEDERRKGYFTKKLLGAATRLLANVPDPSRLEPLAAAVRELIEVARSEDGHGAAAAAEAEAAAALFERFDVLADWYPTSVGAIDVCKHARSVLRLLEGVRVGEPGVGKRITSFLKQFDAYDALRYLRPHLVRAQSADTSALSGRALDVPCAGTPVSVSL